MSSSARAASLTLGSLVKSHFTAWPRCTICFISVGKMGLAIFIHSMMFWEILKKSERIVGSKIYWLSPTPTPEFGVVFKS